MKSITNTASNPVTREGGPATIVSHHSVIGSASITVRPDGTEYKEPVRFDRIQLVRSFKVGEPRPYAQYTQSIVISFLLPRKRNWQGYHVVPDNITYYTIENETGLIYDSRQDVPCDMAKFAETKKRFVQEYHDRGFPVIGAND